MTQKTIAVQAIKHTDVRGNDLLYLKLSYAQRDVLINVGKKTFDAVTELLESPLPNTNGQQELKAKVENR